MEIRLTSNLVFDNEALTLNTGKLKMALSKREAMLMDVLVSNANKPVHVNILQQHIWGCYGDGLRASLTRLVYRLRRLLKTTQGVHIRNYNSRYTMEINYK